MFLENFDWPLIISLVVLGIIGIIVYLKINLKICDPNEILIFSGKKRKLKTGEVVGYRVIRGGMGLRGRQWSYGDIMYIRECLPSIDTPISKCLRLQQL